jgi:hypothetical protein
VMHSCVKALTLLLEFLYSKQLRSCACDPSDLIPLQLSLIPVHNQFETGKYPLEERGGSSKNIDIFS